MESFLNRWMVLSLIFVPYLTKGISALNCHCDDGSQCKSNSCVAARNWYGAEHCQLLYDPSINGEKAWRGCNLANSNCDIVSESRSVDVTFTKGKLSSFGGCCGDENCDVDTEGKLNQIKNTTCALLSANDTATSNTGFSCHCEPNDMITLFDLSVERGVQWLSTAIGENVQVMSNASRVFENSTMLRRKMSSFCTNNMCSANTMAAAGISKPADSFPVCAHLVRSDNGKAVRGCTFAPLTLPPKDAVRRLQTTFPANPIAGAYDVRVGVNASDRYSFIFECRSDMCNERQFYENVVSQCMPGVDLPAKLQVAVEPTGAAGTGLGAGVVHGAPAESGTVAPAAEATTILGTAVPEKQHNHEEGTTMEVHVHNATEVPAAPETAAPTDATGTTIAVIHHLHDASTKPGGSAARQVLHLICLVPVVIIVALK